ncbi:phosphoribosylanthranilate isomerase [Clostridia bacterium]|nr:phosphoribosylanthranilate isomerase [Clostridia bacterium]
MNTKIKICGISSLETIEVLNHMKADYVGFVFANSRRRVSLEKAMEIARRLDPNIQRVGVFVDETVENINLIRSKVGLDIVQLHGNESLEYIGKLGGSIWKALPGNTDSAKKCISYLEKVEKVLLDAMTQTSPGGNNQTLNWNKINGFVPKERLVLAGGLNTSNVREAICALSPSVIDVSSGVETEGKKDDMKIRKFMEEVRNAR